MTKEKKDEIKARIFNANRSELIVILYDMMFLYLEDARQAYNENMWDETKLAIRRLEDILRRLEDDLDFKYEISRELFRLYQYCLEETAKTKVTKDIKHLENVDMVLNKLYIGMKGMAKEDDSKPLVKRKPSIIAGLTYGKTSINEVCQNISSVGYLA